MKNNIAVLKNNPDFIRNLIHGNNIIWYLMYYDELIIKPSYHLTFLENSGSPFYNAAHAVHTINHKLLSEVENYYKQHNIDSAFYLDPASTGWLKPFLTDHHYSEIPSELENWWGILMEEDVMHVKFQDYLKIPESQITIKIVNPQNIDDLNQFLMINQIASQLPNHIIDKLRTNMQKRVYQGATNTLFIVYVNHVPASVRTLGIYSNMAYLAEAGTLPQFQKLGLHTFSTLFLLKYAYARGARMTALTCTHDSVTNFTSKRVGLELLFQRQFMLKQ